MLILQMPLSIPTPPQHLSSARVLTGPDHLCLLSKLSQLSLHSANFRAKTTTIRMGGGPRTYPGGVSKWQWKRMQAKKAKQLLKARLCRERQIYEMRKRAELKVAVSELEKPWEVVERAPTLFSVRADEQLKVLADRFQRPGGFDMWSEKDGPQLFETVGGVLSARFFPKGVVHSVKPYGRITSSAGSDGVDELSEPQNGGAMVTQRNGYKNSRRSSSRRVRGGSCSEGEVVDSSVAESSYPKNSMETSGIDGPGKFYGDRSGKASSNGKLRKKGTRRRVGSEDSNGLNGLDSGLVAFDTEQRGEPALMRGGSRFSRSSGLQKLKESHDEEYDMSLQQDGSYGYKGK